MMLLVVTIQGCDRLEIDESRDSTPEIGGTRTDQFMTYVCTRARKMTEITKGVTHVPSTVM
jgi:hypothetical protein